MNVSIGERWEEFVDQLLQSGRYGSASEVVREGLRLVEERESRLKALQATLDPTPTPDDDASGVDVHGTTSPSKTTAPARPRS